MGFVPPGGLARFCVLSVVAALGTATVACEDMRADRAYVRGDYRAAVKELRDLAEHGEARAQYDLALLYDKGQGVAQDDKQALHWYRKAAEQGEARAQYNVGLMYAKGQGVQQDDVEAYLWIGLAAAQGEARAPDARAFLDGRMAPDQIAKGQALIREYLERKKTQTCWYCELFHRGSPP